MDPLGARELPPAPEDVGVKVEIPGEEREVRSSDPRRTMAESMRTADTEPHDLPQETSIKLFMEKNPNLNMMKAARDGRGGIWKLLDAAIFGFLLFSPALPVIPTMKQPAVVGGLWICILVIMWCKIEYCHRAELWYICLYRGIILDFPKTNTLKGWMCQSPMFFAYSFILIFGAVTYVGLDPKFTFDETQWLLQTILGIVALLFALVLTKSFVDLEGAPSLLTLNMVMHLFQDPEFLKEKGFKVVAFAHLKHFVDGKRAARDTTFSWDELHSLDCEKEKGGRISLIGGTKVWRFLRAFKDEPQEQTPLTVAAVGAEGITKSSV